MGEGGSDFWPKWSSVWQNIQVCQFILGEGLKFVKQCVGNHKEDEKKIPRSKIHSNDLTILMNTNVSVIHEKWK